MQKKLYITPEIVTTVRVNAGDIIENELRRDSQWCNVEKYTDERGRAHFRKRSGNVGSDYHAACSSELEEFLFNVEIILKALKDEDCPRTIEFKATVDMGSGRTLIDIPKLIRDWGCAAYDANRRSKVKTAAYSIASYIEAGEPGYYIYNDGTTSKDTHPMNAVAR